MIFTTARRSRDAIYAGDIDRAQTLFVEHTRLLRHEPPGVAVWLRTVS